MLFQARKATNEDLEHCKGVKGPSIAARIPYFDVSTAFVPDYMHTVLLGVMMMLLSLCFNPSNKDKDYYINKSIRREINLLLKSIRPPDFIPRVPSNLSNFTRWKASELRAFLLFYGAILLKNKLAKKYYEHFLLLVRAIHILMQSNIKKVEIDLAKTLLFIFVSDIEDLYGLSKFSFNVHQLLHLCEAVRMWGPLWSWSAFPFEDGNGSLVRLIHGTSKLKIELSNTIKIINATSIVKHLMEDHTNLKFEDYGAHPDGPPVLKNFTIDNNDLTAILKTTLLEKEDFQTRKIKIYRRAQFRNEKFISLLYTREKKRKNYCVYWNDRRSFGYIKFFITIDYEIFAVVRELLLSRNPIDQVTVSEIPELKFGNILLPVNDSYCIHAIPLERIEGKMVFVMNYVCFSPNYFERK